MDELIRVAILSLGIPTVLGIAGYLMKTLFTRLDHIEKEVSDKLDVYQVRQIVADKIDPLREDIQELKIKLDKIVDLLLHK